MALPQSPPKETADSIKRGDDGWPVYALQTAFNASQRGLPKLAPDGAFGQSTHDVVRKFQTGFGLFVDGIAGPATQKKLVEYLDARVHNELPGVPGGLMRGFAEGEGGNRLAAVNWSSPGGVDCGIVQYRVLGPPYSLDKLKDGFNPYESMLKAATEWEARADKYYTYTYVSKRRDRVEYSKRLAVLHHNWPYGADRLSQGETLSDRVANWVPKGVKFPDGQPVITYADWAEYYAMGSATHSWEGYIPRYVTNWGA